MRVKDNADRIRAMKEQNSFDILVECLQQLPSVGRKSALRLAYALAVEKKPLAELLENCVSDSMQNVSLSAECGVVC
ncbi:MAG: hypothetical protein K2M51_00465 [Helicobacter sp.]|nr:hypothetical protein [Helicobacter sp.]